MKVLGVNFFLKHSVVVAMVEIQFFTLADLCDRCVLSFGLPSIRLFCHSVYEQDNS